jgi:glycosyltransferase involved in cell wall biosynthesis
VLEEAGHRVALHEARNPQGTGAALTALARSPWNRPAAAAVLESARHHRSDVVHVHNTWFSLSPLVFAALKEAGFPVVFTIHNYRLACVNALLYRNGKPCEDCVGRLPWRGIAHRCYRGSAAQSGMAGLTIAMHRMRHTWNENVDVFIALTEFSAGILKRSGVPGDRLVVKPNFVEDPGPRLQPPSAADTILYVGRLTEEKGVLDLLDAWRGVSLPQLSLAVIGDGPVMNRATAAASPNVTVLGRLSPSKVRTQMLGARALVLPSRWYEGMPMVALEAMAAGLPVVVPDHGPLREITGRGGVVFTGCDVGALSGALERMADNATVDDLGAASRSEYRARFAASEGANDLIEIYKRALETRT